MTPKFFPTREKFREWLSKNHGSKTELWIGYYKKGSGRKSITYKEALDESLCFGWIDGVVRRIDEEAYMQRFSPRKPKSYWSVVNTKRAKQLIAEKRMTPAGLAAFERRDASATARYSFERETARFSAEDRKQFRANRTAWEFFEAQAPYYRRLMTHWVSSAKQEETRARRLAKLIEVSAAGRRVDVLKPRKEGA